MTRAHWLLLPALLAAAPLPAFALSLKMVSETPSGPSMGSFTGIPVADTDQDSLLEVFFNAGRTYDPSDPLRWEVWEYRPVNRWQLVYADTGEYPYPPGVIVTGNLDPWDVGDVDGDGLPDLVGGLPLSLNGELWSVLGVIESEAPGLHPSRLAWHDTLGFETALLFCAYADLDQDGRGEAFVWRGRMFESRGNDSLVSVPLPSLLNASTYVFGDFDGDGLREVVTGFSDLRVFENAELGRDTYALVFQEQTGMQNGYDIFSGNVLEGGARPAFFICYERYHEGNLPVDLSLWMRRPTGDNTFERHFVDSHSLMVHDGGHSDCGDLDGDGEDELVWVTTGQAAVYKAAGENRFDRVGTVPLQSGRAYRARVVDVNQNGYGELMLAGYGRVRLQEVEAVRVLYPDRVQELVNGDTCRIRWRSYTPPRCDSVSLFLKTDTVVPEGQRFWRLDTIVTGLAASESSYLWVVPDTVLSWAKVLAIAYGPGWQYDESDTAFRILPGGVAELAAPSVRDWTLSVSPNPLAGFGTIGYEVPVAADVRLRLFDASGRLVRVVASGRHLPGRYSVSVPVTEMSAGVYFVCLDAAGQTLRAKLTVR